MEVDHSLLLLFLIQQEVLSPRSCVCDGSYPGFADQMPSGSSVTRALCKIKKLWSVLQLEMAFAPLATQTGKKTFVTSAQAKQD